MSDAPLWLLNWENRKAYYLGAPNDWTKQTAALLQAQVMGNTLSAEVVQEGTAWFRVLAGQDGWQAVICDLPPIVFANAAEKQLAMACAQRSRRERLVALCEAYLRVDMAVHGAIHEPEWSGDHATV
jgi:hypothetical protein